MKEKRGREREMQREREGGERDEGGSERQRDVKLIVLDH